MKLMKLDKYLTDSVARGILVHFKKGMYVGYMDNVFTDTVIYKLLFQAYENDSDDENILFETAYNIIYNNIINRIVDILPLLTLFYELDWNDTLIETIKKYIRARENINIKYKRRMIKFVENYSEINLDFARYIIDYVEYNINLEDKLNEGWCE